MWEFGFHSKPKISNAIARRYIYKIPMTIYHQRKKITTVSFCNWASLIQTIFPQLKGTATIAARCVRATKNNIGRTCTSCDLLPQSKIQLKHYNPYHIRNSVVLLFLLLLLIILMLQRGLAIFWYQNFQQKSNLFLFSYTVLGLIPSSHSCTNGPTNI